MQADSEAASPPPRFMVWVGAEPCCRFTRRVEASWPPVGVPRDLCPELPRSRMRRPAAALVERLHHPLHHRFPFFQIPFRPHSGNPREAI